MCFTGIEIGRHDYLLPQKFCPLPSSGCGIPKHTWIELPGIVSELLLKSARISLDYLPSQLDFAHSNRDHDRLSAGYRVKLDHGLGNNLVDRALA